MGSRGPARDSNQKLDARGSWRGKQRKKEAAKAVEEEVADFVCPDWLLPAALEEWERVVPLLKKANRLHQTDAAALGIYCQCYARWKEAEVWMSEHGTVATVRNDKGEVKSTFPVPRMQIATKMLEKVLRYQQEFGLTPAARQRLGTEDATPKADDDEQFLSLVG